MAIKIGTAAAMFTAKPYLKIAITGHSGTGKTEWAARSPRPLIILTERQGMASVMSANPEAIVVHVETWNDFEEIFNAVKSSRTVEVDGQPAAQFTLGGQDFSFQTLIVDSFTDLQRLLVARFEGTDVRGSMEGKSLGLQEWGKVISGTENVLRQQRLLPCNTVFIFLAEDETVGETRMTLPMLTGKKLPFAIGQYFNASGMMRTSKGADGTIHRIVWASNSDRGITKPAPGFPPFITNTKTPGETTLGSLLLYSFPGLPVAAEAHDSAEFVEQTIAVTGRADSPVSGGNGGDVLEIETDAPTPPAASDSPTPAPRRRRG